MALHNRSIGPFLSVDFVFIMLGLASILAFTQVGAEEVAAISASSSPGLLAGVMIVATIVLSMLAALAFRLDKRRTDEFALQAMANGAVIALMVTFLTNLVLGFAPVMAPWLVKPSGDLLMAVLMGSWASGYMIFRLRGTA